MYYSIESGYLISVKGFGFLFFAINIVKNTIRNLSGKYSQERLGSAKRFGAQNCFKKR